MSNTVCGVDISLKLPGTFYVIQYVHGAKGMFSKMCLRIFYICLRN